MVYIGILLISLAFLGFGYFTRGRMLDDNSILQKFKIHPIDISAIGWVIFGIYWFLQTSNYLDAQDYTNALFVVAAFPFFTFIAYKEHESITSGNIEGLRFLTGITVFTVAGYTIISAIPAIEGGIEYINAYFSSAFLSAVGFPAEAGAIDYVGNEYYYRSNDNLMSVPILHNGRNDILVTLSCTAFPSIFIFTSAILCATEPLRKRLTAFLLIIPGIFILNIIRMSMIAYLTYSETTSPEFAHHVLGKAGSLLALMFLAWVLFTFLPSILTNIREVLDLLFTKSTAKNSSSNSKE